MKDLCEFCQKGQASEPIYDSASGREIWICTDCDTRLDEEYHAQSFLARLGIECIPIEGSWILRTKGGFELTFDCIDSSSSIERRES